MLADLNEKKETAYIIPFYAEQLFKIQQKYTFSSFFNLSFNFLGKKVFYSRRSLSVDRVPKVSILGPV